MMYSKQRRALLGALALAGCGIGFANKPAERVIKMTVKRFEYMPREIRVKQGEPVVLEIISLDVAHGFNLPDFKTRADVLPGIPARVRLQPDRVGTFTFRCDLFCGTGHEELDGVLVVSA